MVGICNWGKCGNKTAFSKKTGRPYYYCSSCAKTKAQKDLEKYYKNPDKQKNRSKKYLESVKNKFFVMYGNKCVCCSIKNRKFLTLDHILGDGKEDRIHPLTKRARNSYSCYKEAIENYKPDYYQVLCMNCNFNKRKNQSCDCNIKCVIIKKEFLRHRFKRKNKQYR